MREFLLIILGLVGGFFLGSGLFAAMAAVGIDIFFHYRLFLNFSPI